MNIIESYGSMVWSDTAMRESLEEPVYRSLRETIELGLPLDPQIATPVANAMKEWATLRGATHFTHWFQPLSGATAEKHEAFIAPKGDGTIVLEFSGKELTRGESDASSFPNGGLRATFEARGYTAWDCTSPAFIKDNTLYIPTVFCSYTGEALDEKTPLLRSMETINRQTMRILRHFGDTTTKKVISTMGAEQEYFLVDRDLYKKRLDLLMCGRTLMGAKPPKGQIMSDHYYGRMRIRVSAFMRELDEELWKLGVPARTKHNEAAPAQHELAPIFTDSNTASDHNNLMMEVMKKVAKRHNLACLLHEKPFSGVNGSGKHNNWSLATNTGKNLLDPGKTPHENMQFILLLCAVLKAIDEYSDLLRASVATAGNDERLGGHEAPPAIISVFLGDELTEILSAIKEERKVRIMGGETIKLGLTSLPPLPKDTTDRNRTSPFAFTGNKFEFRMCGSSASIARPQFVLNTIAAEQFRLIADRLDTAVDERAKTDEIHAIINEIMEKNGRIIYNGNNYSGEWHAEAAKRKLLNLRISVDSFDSMIRPEVVRMFGIHGVLSESECVSRCEVLYDSYNKALQVESDTMKILVKRQILPAVTEYAGELAKNAADAKVAGIETDYFAASAKWFAQKAAELKAQSDEFDKLTAEPAKPPTSKQQAKKFKGKILVKMREIRTLCDQLESQLPEAKWPMPTYADLMYRL